ncbi:zinc finger protein 384-like [Odontomachus brunneus]|uniref:zinc finger protein 384-like n=1 Tax=Odontomachus brunneus TaxID=486640 RepID=UPI0013F192AC|nr:zinc finger protein 384-like [Odontomachus brunneus]XP_032677815.1 zinc finger protein 384-like [Odontomachus brunneus]XP_032677816.1 zinc finger protein 384-like [Odontomachus brunneus]XP_032677817.1 zinc finger protein 384-like [Odontomachus brunneus]
MSAPDQHICVLCNAKFKSKSVLQEHFRKHGKELDLQGRPLNRDDMTYITQCDICLITFNKTSTAINHRFKVHPNAPIKFYCHYCGKLFPVKTHRDNHQLSHDISESERKEDHRKCKECNVLFYNEKALKYHYRCVHQTMAHLLQPLTTSPPNNKVKINSMNNMINMYYCHLCGIEYLRKYNLQRHLKRIHMQNDDVPLPADVIKCTVCSAVFCNRKAYAVHNRYHNPSDLYIIAEEQKHNIIKKEFDIKVETTTNKHVRLKNPKRQRRCRWKNVEAKEIKLEMKQEVKQEIKEIKQEYMSFSDDEAACTNGSTSPVTSREIWCWNKEFPSANDSFFDNCEKIPSVFQENSVT